MPGSMMALEERVGFDTGRMFVVALVIGLSSLVAVCVSGVVFGWLVLATMIFEGYLLLRNEHPGLARPRRQGAAKALSRARMTLTESLVLIGLLLLQAFALILILFTL